MNEKYIPLLRTYCDTLVRSQLRGTGERTSVKEAVGFAYWGVLTAIFFIWGFLGNDGSGIQGNSWISWRYNWIVFAVGGILFPIVMCICNYFADRQKKD